MATFTTEGIIVKRSNFGEADRILTVVTPYRGKVKVLAKGVRKITSRRGGNVELLNKVKMHLFAGNNFNILTEVEGINTFPRIKSDLMLLTYASHVIELTERLLPEGQPNPGAYKLLEAVLERLEENPRQIFIRAYEVKLLSDLGFWSVSQIEVSGEVAEILNKLQMLSWDEIEKMDVNPSLGMELERILRYYMEGVLESKLKSAEVIKKIKAIN